MRKYLQALLGMIIAAVSLVTTSPLPAHAAQLKDGVSCSVQARLWEDLVGGGGMSYMHIKHTVTCNRAVEQLIVYGTDYKEGFQSASTVHGTETCFNTNVCVLRLFVPTQSYSSARGWYITRTSADVGKPGNQRYYGSVLEVRQRMYWE